MNGVWLKIAVALKVLEPFSSTEQAPIYAPTVSCWFVSILYIEREREREREGIDRKTRLSVTPGHRTVQEGLSMVYVEKV